MNESETRAELIDPKLKVSGWGEVESSKILREHHFTDGKLLADGTRTKPEIADNILVYKNQKLAVIEAKQESFGPTEGLAQAKIYAQKLNIQYTYSTNGKEVYQINMKTGKEDYIDSFPTPEQLWIMTFTDQNDWKDKFNSIPLEVVGDSKAARYYQEIAINKTLNAVAENKQKILLTLATGTGKTFIAFQIAWKLFQTRWNLNRDGGRRPRVLFLADRNFLANQAFNSFETFPNDALVRINPLDIRKKGEVPMNGSIFFTIFQTFMSGPGESPYFGQYPRDFFDFIIIDECHRGGANDESNWRDILNYFAPAVQLGLTATPKRKDNVDTYSYFGEPVYTYSLKEGINDGFLTPFRVKRVQTTMDTYVYTTDDEVIEGEIEEGKEYEEKEFNVTIEIRERELARVKIFMKDINQNEKTLVFCANQAHAALIRDLINQTKESNNPNYCVRVTANDGERGEQYLREFQDNEKTIPTILTTSQKLSTGVDARNIRNIVFLRPINSMIEFKQIIGRGTRTFEGKTYFTIYDFVNAYKLFFDPEWDGEPLNETEVKELQPGEVNDIPKEQYKTKEEGIDEKDQFKKVIVKLHNGKEIQSMVTTSFYSIDGKPLSEQEFLDNISTKLLESFQTREEFIEIWSDPIKRKSFLDKLLDGGYDQEKLESLQRLVNGVDSDLFDVIMHIAFFDALISKTDRAKKAGDILENNYSEDQKDFIEFVLAEFIENGAEELSEENLPKLLNLKYGSIADAEEKLDGVDKIREIFFELQKKLFQ